MSSELCAVCGFDGPRAPYVRLRDAALQRCTRCESVLYSPRPDPTAQHGYHDSEAYFDHPYLQLRRDAQQRLDRRCASMFGRISKAAGIRSFAGLTHLDVGCDTGAFLESAARQFHTKPVGVDVARRAVAEAVKNGIDAYACTIEDAPPQVKDASVVTGIDVVEHVTDPHGFIEAIAARMTPGGVCYLETPNIRSWLYAVGRVICNLAGQAPAAMVRLFPPEHIQYFSAEGLSKLAEASGLEVLAVGTRVLPAAEIAVSRPVQFALGALQSLDRLTRREILMWVVLRRSARVVG
jgi:2-polyprenyl-3-methyl-5-hydroxy-6-metoxy-1,4-benzoquinol methylase